MKAIVVLVVFFFASSFGYDRIWELTGGNSKGIGHGFNIRTMQQTGEQLLDFQQWDSSSILVNGKRYAVPAESFGGGVMRVRMENSTSIMTSFEDFFQQRVKSWGISVGVTIYGVGVDVSYSKLRGEIKALTRNFSNAFTIGEYLWHGFDLEVDYMDTPLDPDFINDIKRLPATYDRNLYRRFINAWGSHVISKAGYGCRFNYSLSYDKKMLETRGSQWTQTNIGVALSYSYGGFGISIGVDFGKFKNTTKIDGEFLAKSMGKTELLGGDETLSSGLAAWYPTCEKNRQVLLEKSKIVPIAELIRFDKTRQASMKLALQDFARSP